VPIVLSKAEVAKRGGKYQMPAPARASEPAPAPVAPPPAAPTVNDAVAERLAETIHMVGAGQADQARQLSQVAALMAKTGGRWLASVKSRDQHGRILTLEIKSQN